MGTQLQVRDIPTIRFERLVYEVPGPSVGLFQKLGNRCRVQCRRNIPEENWRGYLRILDNISGDVYKGEFLAIIGPSGSGKTTLQDIISNRRARQLRRGVLRFEGHAYGPWIKPHLGYCKQEDVLYTTETVRETVEFAVRLRLRDTAVPTGVAAERVMRRLELLEVADSRVGAVPGQALHSGSKTGLSGGERRRVALAVEIAAKPQLLLCDEPTSGLDQVSATKIVRLLKRLAEGDRRNRPIAVVATIHQPSSEYWELFDRVLVLSQGRCFYFGSAKAVGPFFTRLGYQILPFENPAEFLLQVASDGSFAESSFPHSFQERAIYLPGVAEFERQRRMLSCFTAFQGAHTRAVQATSDTVRARPAQGAPAAPGSAPVVVQKRPIMQHKHEKPRRLPYAAPWSVQFKAILRRNIRQKVREPGKVLAIFSQFLFLALFGGFLFYDIGTEYTSINNRAGIIFFSIIAVSFAPTFSNSVSILTNRIIYFREHSVGTFGTSAYFLAYQVVLTIIQVIGVLIFCPIIYWTVGLNPDLGRFAIYTSIVFLIIFCTMAFGGFIVTLFSKYVLGYVVGGIILVVFLVLSGAFINQESIPPGYEWLSYLSFFRYAFEALIVNDFEGLTFTCDDPNLCPMSGEEALALRGFSGKTLSNTVVKDAAIIFGFGVFYSFLMYLNIRFRRF